MNPNFDRPWMDPTPLQCAFGWLAWQPARVLARLTPWRWLLLPPKSLRSRLACHIHAAAWYWEERAAGRI